MIDDTDHPDMVRAFYDLTAHLAALHCRRAGRVDHEYYRQIIALRDGHRAAWCTRGVDFPHLVIFGVPRLGVVELWRADLELPSIRVKLVNFVRAYPEVLPTEVAAALQAAYPSIRPGDLVHPVMTAHATLAGDTRRGERTRDELERMN